MVVIIVIMIVLFLVLLGWTWHNLGNIDKIRKIKFIMSGIVIIYIITFIIYNISKIGIEYENKEAMQIIRTVFVMLFTIVNGYIMLPYIFRKIDQINNNEIDNEKLKKSIVIFLIIMLLLIIFEINYFANIQRGILNVQKGQSLLDMKGI